MTTSPTLGRSRARFVIVFAAVCGLWLVHAGSAQASCLYNEATKTVTAQQEAESTLLVSGVELWFGSLPAPCGAATTTNTDLIKIVRSADRLTLDESGGRFAPGATTDGEGTTPEIEIEIEGVGGPFVYRGTSGPDGVTLGSQGINLNGTCSGPQNFSCTDYDLDVKMSLHTSTEVYLGDGDDIVSGAGGGGTWYDHGPFTAWAMPATTP